MEKIIVILGNGFDLQCGLKSDYKNFYNDCVSKKSQFYDFIKKDIVGKTRFVQHSTYHIDNENSYFIIRDYVSGNINTLQLDDVSTWEVILTILSANHFENENEIYWKDIEGYISDFLTIIDDRNININYLGLVIQRIQNHESINESDLIYYKLAFSIIELFKIERTDLAFNTSKKYLNNFISSKDSFELYRFMLNELYRFEFKLSEYLCHIYNENKTKYESYAEQLFRLITGDTSDDTSKYILSFNYTLPKVKIANLNGVNVHGSIDGLSQHIGNSIIMGIDRDKIDSNDYTFMFTKTYRKMYLQTHLKSQSLPKSGSYNSVSNIFVYGHSLSEADFSYYFSIFDYYSIYSSDVKINFIYTVYDENKRDDIEHKLYLDITKLFNVYVNRMTNKNQLKNLQHKLLLEQRLIVREIPSLE